jgi:hypothetical protein
VADAHRNLIAQAEQNVTILDPQPDTVLEYD